MSSDAYETKYPHKLRRLRAMIDSNEKWIGDLREREDYEDALLATDNVSVYAEAMAEMRVARRAVADALREECVVMQRWHDQIAERLTKGAGGG